MRFAGERKALAAAILAFFATLFLLNGFLGMPALMPMFLALGATYLIGFFGLVAGWFWARWFTMGLAFSGLVMAVLMGWQVGLETIVLIWGGTHLGALLSLLGQGPAALFDGRKDWRQRFRMDDNAANRLGKAIMRAGASLPYLILAGLAPKQGMGMVLGLGALALAVLGIRALVRLRTWGLFALVGAAGLIALTPPDLTYALSGTLSVLAPLFLIAAVLPFVGPIADQLRVRRPY
jgi:hypothetical protein